MNQTARTLLAKVLACAERGGREALPVTPRYAPEYFSAADPVERDALHAALLNAQTAGAVELEWGRFEETRDLKRIRLRDADRLASFLGKARAAELVDGLDRRLAPILAGAPAWLQASASSARDRWRRGEKACGLGPEDVDEIVTLYRALIAVGREEHRGLDLRRFSVRALGDSKAMERIRARFCRVWREAHDLDLEPEELYAELGLEKFPQPVFIKGPVSVRINGAWLDVGAIRPFLALSPDAIEGLQCRCPRYVLTVENLASYQRHVREIADEGIILFCSGFPSPAFRSFLSRLDQVLDDAVPFFHWGDRDVGGLRILDRLAICLSRHTLRPHLMAASNLDGHPFSEGDIARLQRMARQGSIAAKLAAGWLASAGAAVEQEAQDPAQPSVASGNATTSGTIP